MVVVSIQKMGDEGFERIEMVEQQVQRVQDTVGDGSKDYLVLGSIAYMYPVLCVYVKRLDEKVVKRLAAGAYIHGLGRSYLHFCQLEIAVELSAFDSNEIGTNCPLQCSLVLYCLFK